MINKIRICLKEFYLVDKKNHSLSVRYIWPRDLWIARHAGNRIWWKVEYVWPPINSHYSSSGIKYFSMVDTGHIYSWYVLGTQYENWKWIVLWPCDSMTNWLECNKGRAKSRLLDNLILIGNRLSANWRKKTGLRPISDT